MTHKMGVFSLVGGLAAAFGASLCCVGPLVLLMLGIGGTYATSLTTLSPYRPIFIGITVLFLFLAYWQIYRPFKTQTCEEGTACAEPRVHSQYRKLFWIIVVLSALALISPYLIPLFY